MGKKRHQSFKPFQSSPSLQAPKPAVSVNERLEQLRLEARGSRPIAASVLAHSRSGPALPAHPDIASFLGLQYQEPQARAKPKSRGHLAPKSWTTPGHLRSSSRPQSTTRIYAGLNRLSDLCLYCIKGHINHMTGLGLHYLPPHLKARLLTNLDGRRISGHALQDLVPNEEDEIEHLNLTWLSDVPIGVLSNISERDIARVLRRLTSLRRLTIDAPQLEHFYMYLPRVVEHLSLGVGQSDTGLPSWSAIGTHFLSLKSLTVVDPGSDLLERLASIDWKGSLRTIRTLYIGWSNTLEVEQDGGEAPRYRQKQPAGDFGILLQSWASKIRAQRSPGHHLEVVYGSVSLQ
ncbi:hypothetical protein BCR37DRAFT_387762 [Protomyces lactucae-debilis]|uniref:Uncharacterized protein n=1 Tax=Protomyces lactucae-debilis TaxID=2754530 RepID=A0A1Y2FC76_PROLT|nr:uncharacterized protein BCR37DRAFT_387762 [Protomyces lactucae-debilis]ORY81513.1 hypothetical protein BCR37DRAFT_387762 [Protomyces lactucae-debilis]